MPLLTGMRECLGMVPDKMGLQDNKGPSGVSDLSQWTIFLDSFHRDTAYHFLKLIIVIHYYEGRV